MLSDKKLFYSSKKALSVTRAIVVPVLKILVISTRYIKMVDPMLIKRS